MHVLYVFPSFAPGGAQVRSVQLMNALGAEFEHSVISMDGDYSSETRIDPAVRYRRVAPPPRTSTAALALRRIIRGIRPGLLLTYNWGAMDAVIASLLIPGLRLIHTEDGFGSDEARALKGRRVWARRILLRRAWATVVPSKNLERIAKRQFRLPAARVRYVPNGINCDWFAPGDAGSVPEELGLAELDPVLCSVGHLRREKNLPLLLRALAHPKLERAGLIIAGDGPLRPELERLAREFGLERRIRFTGRVEDPRPYYRAAGLFVMSSDTEQMPVALLEAMACGLPAVCTAVGDCAEMLGGAIKPWIVPPGDLAAYQAALLEAAGDPAKLRQAGRANRERCLRDYSEEAMVERYRDLYTAAVSGGDLPA